MLHETENPNLTPTANCLSDSMLADNRAISATEYVIILTLVALALIAGATLLGQAINNKYVNAAGRINNLP